MEFCGILLLSNRQQVRTGENSKINQKHQSRKEWDYNEKSIGRCRYAEGFY